uniref:DH domain-containing protein n=1 Tax=Meloidogyne incognita TaxID=6306 RepID=A0A914LKR0_MELIC
MSDTKMNNFPQLKQNLVMNGSDPFNHLINQPHSTTNSPSSSSASSSFASTKNSKNNNFNPVHRLHKSEDSTTTLINRLPLNIPSAMLTEEELDGGELLSVEEREEIDPEDGCKVQVWTYHILSADGMEESTIIRRRKMKVNCTESLKRIEFSNGRETKYEEREVINNLDSFTQQPNHTPFRNSSATNERAMEDDEDSAQIGSMLFQTQDSFLRLVREKKDALVKLFPELFTNLRTTPAIFESMPSTVMETIVNEDGSTTTRTKFSKAFSSHYTRQEMFINGVRKECRSRFRAFMEYAGPEGGFCIRLNDHADEDLSEEESNDHEESTSDGKSWISSSGRSLALSEIGEGQSALVIPGKQGQLCVLKDKENNKRWEKAWHAVNEMVQSEERYVQKLALLEKFRSTIERAQLLDRRLQCHLFSNIASLNQFHEQHLLPQLMDRRREWQGTKRISDVLRKQAPFLKMYSEYTNNYKTAVHIFEECMRKKRAFGEIVRQLEQLPECEHLSLVSHLICPVQRVMRYQLLLKEYQKNLLPNDPDWEDTETALTLVLEAASHANEMMRKLDRYRNVLEIQEQLGNSIALVSPGRELLTRSRLFKCSSSTGKVEERLLFVFNDLFLLASERSTFMIGTRGASKYKLRAVFFAKQTQICEGDNLELENSFYLRGSNSAKARFRSDFDHILI